MKRLLTILIYTSFSMHGYSQTDLDITLNCKNNYNCKGCIKCDLSGADLKGHDFQGFSFDGTNFKNADLSGSTFIGGRFEGADFSGAKATNSDFSSTILNKIKVHDADFSDAKFTNSVAKQTDWRRANLTKANFFSVDLSNSTFEDADITDAIFLGSNLYHCNMQVKKGCEALNYSNQYNNMYLGIMQWPIKYCCTKSCNGKIMHWDNPGSCPTDHMEKCNEMAREHGYEVITIPTEY